VIPIPSDNFFKIKTSAKGATIVPQFKEHSQCRSQTTSKLEGRNYKEKGTKINKTSTVNGCQNFSYLGNFF